MSFQFTNEAAFRATSDATSEHYHIPEYLIGMGFRARLLMLAHGNRTFLGRIERYYTTVVPPQHCNDVLSGLIAWTLHIDTAASRRIEVHAADRRDFSKDEALAISAIATSQHSVPRETQMLLSDLIGESAYHEVLNATNRFAATLNYAGLVLSAQNAVLPMGAIP
ncbi:MAG: hypothetical protein ACK5KM_06960 [Hyphomicrobiaceae bacterium]